MPRDPNRIDPILEELGKYWRKHPDLRLAQIVVNMCLPLSPCPSVFHTEDDKILRRLKESNQ